MEKTINECFDQIQNGANIKHGDVEGGFPITRIADNSKMTNSIEIEWDMLE